jgi:hypothetical protein
MLKLYENKIGEKHVVKVLMELRGWVVIRFDNGFKGMVLKNTLANFNY